MRLSGLIASIAIHLMGIAGFVVVESSTISAKTSLSALKVNIFSENNEVSQKSKNHSIKPVLKSSNAQTGVEKVVSAKLVSDLNPEYPWISRMNQEEGSVSLNVTLDKNGVPSLVQISKSSGHHRLDESALIAAKEAQYLNQSEKEVLIQLNLNFELKKKK